MHKLSKESFRRYFQLIGPEWERWQKRNSFYYDAMRDLVRGMTPPGIRVLELGSGTGDLLASLKPSRGAGLNVTQELTNRARLKFPHLD